MIDRNDLQAYFDEGDARALALGNRGPLRFDDVGRLHPDIVDAYRTTGFYVFEGVIDDDEMAELDADLADLLDRTPEAEGASVDRRGRPLQPGLPSLQWAKPLSDPWGGTKLLNGRHPVAMDQPEAATDAPEKAIFLLLGLFESMPSALRVSAHPGVLRVAETLNGSDFVPYNDSIFLKEPGLGAAVAWHQDGTTHWGDPNWDPDIHGVNFMAQLAKTTAANGLWVVPGSHRLGHVDIPGLVAANGGSTLLPDAVPMLCERGDVAVCNRQCLHGSFANASPDPRITLVWGFFRRDAVLGVEVDMPATDANQPPERRRYTEEDIRERAGIVQLAIDARAAHRPDEASYDYAPGASEAGRYADDAARAEALRGYRKGTIFV
jgi:hypothetical protein